ncbi:MAG: hypothetical protein ACXWID_17810, partial [Pyrinomonadaceae bacterium]
MIICPACGSSVEGQLCLGCPACGARAVGPPLAKPEHQLVSFGPAALAALGGGLMLVGFFGVNDRRVGRKQGRGAQPRDDCRS